MKKTLKFTAISVILLILAGGFSSCGNENENTREAYSIKEGRLNVADDEFVTMRVSPEDVFVNSSMKLTIENHSKGDLYYGRGYSLEYLDKENWTEIQLEGMFDHIGIILRAGEKTEELFYVSEKYFHRLGKYRIAKNFSLVSDFPLEIDSNFTLYAEFEVK